MLEMFRSAAALTQDTQHGRQIVSQDTNKRFLQLFTSMVEYLRPAPKLGIAWSGIGFVTLMVFLMIVGCTSVAQNIRATNEAATTPQATSTPQATNTPLSAEIAWTEIQDGDCIISKLRKGIDIESVVIVPCSADWQYRALSSVAVDDFDQYPGESLFRQRAYKECDRHYIHTLSPSADSWALGDRSVICIQESFGLSVTDPEKLDRLIIRSRLSVEDCLNEAPETEQLMVELVSCSGDWQYRALNSFTVDDFERFPGEDLFSQRTYKECDRQYTSAFFPTADSWALGDRSVICIQEGFGLSVTDPEKLDRLITRIRLSVEDCLNEAPETEQLMVELVSCSGEWQYRAHTSFTVDEVERYPGEASLTQRAYKECDRHHTRLSFPTSDSWALGDRTITCLQESFGLSGTDPAKLDRLVDHQRLNVGECFDEAPETEHLLVELVSCSGEWQYRALSSFTVDDFDRYPGEDLFSQRAYKECDRHYTFILFPLADSWALGDRRVTCLQESFGLSGTDPEKLDRLVGSDRLRAEECFDEAPETGHLLVELVNCSSEWQYRVLNALAVEDLYQYPGEGLFDQRAYKGCDRHYSTTLLPTPDSWTLGDRIVICLQEDFGLSATDPLKLDRLVNISRLGDGECYNEAPETEYLLVEVVSCSGGWQYRTLNSYTVDDLDRYPGEGLFSQRAYKECDRRYTITLYPTADSWALGDRRVNCLQEGFGLSGNDPSKLDRLVDSSRLNVEECFNEAPDTEYAMVELVDCSGEWEFQVVDRFLIPFDDAFPGDEYLEGIAGQECDASFDFYYSPTAETWGIGDRTITCVRSSQ